MESIIKENLKKIEEMDKDIWYILMVIVIGMHIWGSLEMMEEKGMENRCTSLMISIQGNGVVIGLMVMDKWIIMRIEINISGNGVMVVGMAMEN